MSCLPSAKPYRLSKKPTVFFTTHEISFMPFSISALSHSDHVSGFHPESEPGASPPGRDAATSSGKERGPSIVPGGNDFSLQPSSTVFRSQPLASSFSTIHLAGEANVVYQVKDPNSKAPQRAHAIDAETGAPLPQGRYVQKNDKGQWIPAKAPQASAPGTAAIGVTPVKLAGDPASYVIKNASNTRTPQPLFRQKPNGNLKQTGKDGIYDGQGGVRRDNRLPGGVDPSKEVRKNRIHLAQVRYMEADQRVEAARQQVIETKRVKTLAKNALGDAVRERDEALRAFAEASLRHDITSTVARDPQSDEARELPAARRAASDANDRLEKAEDSVRVARNAYNEIRGSLYRARHELSALTDAAEAAWRTLYEAEHSSFG